MRIAIALGTRPEIIKMATIIKELENRGADFFIIHTGQHYDWEMSGVFFEELNLPRPDYNLGVGSSTHAVQTGKIMEKIEHILLKESPDILVIVGDTNSTLGAALAAAKIGINIAHVEAGCRSYDLRMPEEINRALIARVSTMNFAPSPRAFINLLLEGIARYKVFLVGHPLMDLLYAIKDRLSLSILNKLSLKPKKYILATFHRAENVDNKKILTEILKALAESPLPVVFPIHPRTRRNITKFDLESYIKDPIIELKPLPYIDFLSLLKNSCLIITDSGGVQQEAAFFEAKTITVRESIEWIETVIYGFNELVQPNRQLIIEAIKRNLRKPYTPPYEKYADRMFGRKGVTKKIVDILLNRSILERIRKLDRKMYMHTTYGYPMPTFTPSSEITRDFRLLEFKDNGEVAVIAIGQDEASDARYSIGITFTPIGDLRKKFYEQQGVHETTSKILFPFEKEDV